MVPAGVFAEDNAAGKAGRFWFGFAVCVHIVCGKTNLYKKTDMQEEKISGLIFARLLRAEMAAKSCLQAELAAAVGVSQAAVSGWLNGAMPRFDKIADIAKALGLHPHYLANAAAYTTPFDLAKRAAAEFTGSQKEKDQVFNDVLRRETSLLVARQKGFEDAELVMREDPPAYGEEDWKTRALRAEASLEELRMQISKLSAAAKPLSPPAVDAPRKTVEYPKLKRTKKDKAQ